MISTSVFICSGLQGKEQSDKGYRGAQEDSGSQRKFWGEIFLTTDTVSYGRWKSLSKVENSKTTHVMCDPDFYRFDESNFRPAAFMTLSQDVLDLMSFKHI